MNADEIREAIRGIAWYHQIDLGAGVVTPGTDNTLARMAMIGLPADLRGKSVLDIGAWDGAFSFEAERRGAARVVAVDSFCWSGSGWGTKAGFECARRLLGSSVEDREIEVLALSPETIGVFDLVLFLGVLYHMKHPLLALERVASVCRGQLILWTQIDMADVERPAAAFYPDAELNNDPTNWWGLNPPAVTGMLKTAGFSRAETVYRWLAPPVRPGGPASQGNAIFHAWIRESGAVVLTGRTLHRRCPGRETEIPLGFGTARAQSHGLAEPLAGLVVSPAFGEGGASHVALFVEAASLLHQGCGSDIPDVSSLDLFRAAPEAGLQPGCERRGERRQLPLESLRVGDLVARHRVGVRRGVVEHREIVAQALGRIGELCQAVRIHDEPAEEYLIHWPMNLAARHVPAGDRRRCRNGVEASVGR